MLNLDLGSGDGREILALGAHCDDIEIGCGGTMLQLAQNPGNRITWVVFSSSPERAAEARECARAMLGDGEHRRLVVHGFRDGFLPWSGAEVKDAFEELKGQVTPDLVFTHYRDDLHQDHRLVSELTWNTFRDHLVLEYEIPKWDGDMGRPNAFVPLEPADLDAKLTHVLGAYASQRGKPWFTDDLLRALPRIRGMECRSRSGLAEAFHARKLLLAP